MILRPRFQTGDCVVFRKWKHSPLPGPRAQRIVPSVRGENYCYCVEKIWRIVDVLSDGRLELRTRRGKIRYLRPDDPNLRKPTLNDRIRYRARLSQIGEQAVASAASHG